MFVGVISSPWTKHVYIKILKNKICEKRNCWTCPYFFLITTRMFYPTREICKSYKLCNIWNDTIILQSKIYAYVQKAASFL